MTKAKNTKRALLTSVLSLMLCMAMLVGSTFAWFTDNVTSGKNKIVAGNLDVELEYSTDGKTWTSVDETTNMFKEDALWEPGYTEVVYLQVKNAGSLALKYRLGINVADKVIGKTADDKDIDLADFIKFGVVETATAYTADEAGRTAARNAVKEKACLISAGYSSDEGHLTKKGTSKMLALVVYMPEEIGNEANHGTGKTQPEIYMGINLVATQDTVEKDSFDEKYDENAVYPEAAGGNDKWYDADANELTISTAAHLVDLAKRVNKGETFAGKTITLANDIALDGVSNWTPIGNNLNPFRGTFDGNGKTVSKLFFDHNSVKDVAYVGFFGYINNATIKNLTVSGNITVFTDAVVEDETAMIPGYYCGGICALSSGRSTITNCVSNVNIDGTKTTGSVLAAGILGIGMANSGNSVTISSCTNNGNIEVGRDGAEMCVAAGITSMASGSAIIVTEDCTNTAEKIIAYGEESVYGDITANEMMGF